MSKNGKYFDGSERGLSDALRETEDLLATETPSKMFGKLRAQLEQTANAMLYLAQNLNEQGQELKSHEKELCRLAMYQTVDEILTRAKAEFLAGRHPDYVNDTLYEFNTLVKLFND